MGEKCTSLLIQLYFFMSETNHFFIYSVASVFKSLCLFFVTWFWGSYIFTSQCIQKLMPVSCNMILGTSLMVQWLRLQTANVGGDGSIPSQDTRSHILCSTSKRLKKKDYFGFFPHFQDHYLFSFFSPSLELFLQIGG